jgi:uncharacterized protein YaeQ
MAQKATIFKAAIQIADMDRHYYADHTLTLARHPSETDERMLVRLLAFALYADEALLFGKGLSSDDEPDLWQKDLTGQIERWVFVGLPDERTVRKACGRSAQVAVVCYGRATDIWWRENGETLARQANLSVVKLPADATMAMANLASRNMQFQFSIQDGHVMVTSDACVLSIEPQVLLHTADKG